MNQLLGHATHGQNLKTFLNGRENILSWILEVPFIEPHRLYGRMRQDVMFRIYMDTLRSLGRKEYAADALFFHTLDTALFSSYFLRRTPSVVSLDATPLQFKRLYGFDQPLNRPLTFAEKCKVALLKGTRLKMRLVNSILKRARHVVTWSEWARKSVIEDYGVSGEKVTCIPPGIDTERFVPKLKPAGERTRIIFVGGDFVRKGGALLVRWMQEKGRQLNCELHLVTKTPVASAENVFVHANIDPNSDGLVALLQQSDIFALPTTAECFGIAILEAMAIGLPVLSTQIAAIPEIIRHGSTGVLIAPADYEALSSELQSLVADPARRRMLGAAARAEVQARFSMKNYERLLDCFLHQTS